LRGFCTGPAALVWLPPEKQKYSQWTLPRIVPPASSMRVTMVASTSGTYPSSVEAPFIIGTPARHTLSLSAMRFAPELAGGRAVDSLL